MIRLDTEIVKSIADYTPEKFSDWLTDGFVMLKEQAESGANKGHQPFRPLHYLIGHEKSPVEELERIFNAMVGYGQNSFRQGLTQAISYLRPADYNADIMVDFLHLVAKTRTHAVLDFIALKTNDFFGVCSVENNNKLIAWLLNAIYAMADTHAEKVYHCLETLVSSRFFQGEWSEDALIAACTISPEKYVDFYHIVRNSLGLETESRAADVAGYLVDLIPLNILVDHFEKFNFDTTLHGVDYQLFTSFFGQGDLLALEKLDKDTYRVTKARGDSHPTKTLKINWIDAAGNVFLDEIKLKRALDAVLADLELSLVLNPVSLRAVNSDTYLAESCARYQVPKFFDFLEMHHSRHAAAKSDTDQDDSFTDHEDGSAIGLAEDFPTELETYLAMYAAEGSTAHQTASSTNFITDISIKDLEDSATTDLEDSSAKDHVVHFMKRIAEHLNIFPSGRASTDQAEGFPYDLAERFDIILADSSATELADKSVNNKTPWVALCGVFGFRAGKETKIGPNQ